MNIVNARYTHYLEAFSDSVSRYPDRIALADEYGSDTYAELDKISNVVAYQLMKQGVHKGDTVLVYLPRSRKVIVSALAIWKAGCVYIPTDADYPTERIEYMYHDANVACIITTKELWARKTLDVSKDCVLFLDTILTFENYTEDFIFPTINADDDAFIIYTSGSTGKPKGVLHTHRSLYSHINWQPDNESPFTKESSFMDAFSISSIVSVMDLFSVLLCGGCSYIVSERIRMNPNQLYKYIKENNITNLIVPTNLGILLVEHYDMHFCALRIGSEKIPNFHSLSQCNITELYGCSEGGIAISTPIIGNENPMPLGRIRNDMQCMIVDEQLQPVQTGEVGELICSGATLGKGYLNLPEQTAEKWVNLNGKRWFRTGDLCYMDKTGMLYYVQRNDFMIKLRGFRIEPSEAEKQIRICASTVTDAVVVVKIIAGEEYLCCYYESSEELNIPDIKSKLSKVLPSYMVPEYWVKMEKLPRNANGKLDRLTLPEPMIENNERALTSLEVMRIAADTYEKYGVEIDVLQLLRTKSRKEIQSLIESAVAEQKQALPSMLSDEPKSAPLSFSQIGVYFDCLANPDSLMYNLPMLLHLPNSVSAELLKKALECVIDAHPCIRTCIDGNRLIRQNGAFDIPIRKISEKELPAYKAVAVCPFTLKGKQPLFRLEIVETENSIYLFSDFHHLICDGFSYNLFFEELIRSLSGETLQREKFTAMQFAVEQDKLRSSASHEETLKYWGKRISVLSSASKILADRYDTPAETGMERCVEETVNPENIRTFARQLGVNPSAVYLSAFLLVVAAYTDEEDVGITTVSNGRKDVRIGKSFGMFVNTLPIVASVRAENTADFVQEVQKTLIGAIEHENCAFSEIVSRFDYKSEIMFVYQEGLLNKQNYTQSGFTTENLETGTAKFPISMSVTGNDNDIRLELCYDENRYSDTMMQEMCRTTAFVLEQLCKTEKLSQIKFCDENQIIRLNSFNHDLPPEEETETVASMFKKTAQNYPDRKAVVFKEQSLTYRQLDVLTDKLARQISARYVSKNISNHEPVVSILVNRGMNMPVCMLAALKAGCAYQPLDPSYPAERISYMIEDAQPVLLIADSDCLSLAGSFKGDVLKTDEIFDLQDIENVSEATVCPENLFILLYTSGSTGKPKGVMLKHKNLTAFCRWYKKYFDLKPEHKVSAYISFGFDANMQDFYPALTTGACVHVIPEEMRLDMNVINSYFEKNEITHSAMPTQMGIMFHKTQKNHSLKHLIVGGEKLVSVKPGEGYTLYNCYGPTECTICSTIMPVLKQEPNIPIGRPVDSLKCIIADKKLRRLPVGAIGELVICGAQVGFGYLNLQEKTAEVFYTQDGMRAYRTGDIVRYRNNGDIEFVSRKDEQVKIRGFRVELKEIETVIREYNGIKDVTVQAFDENEGGKFIAAYIVCDDSLCIDDLKSYILTQKPSYMLPASIMRISAIPLNVNQKVDKKSLPTPVFSTESNYIEPVTENECIVASAIARIIGIKEKVSVLDGFAELGGDSINALRLSTELEKEHLEITPNMILRLNTVREIAKAAVPLKTVSDNVSKHYTGAIENTAIVQYFYDMKLPVPSHFNQAMLYKAASPIDLHLLSKSFNALVQHHDILRAISRDGHLFVKDMSEKELFILAEETVNTIEDFEAKANVLQSGFDIEKGSLISACVFHTKKGDYLLIVAHHLIIDGVSWRILTEDLNTAYTALVSGQAICFPSATNSYADYAVALKKYCESDDLNAQKTYWDGIRKHLLELTCTDRTEGTPAPIFERLNLRLNATLTNTLLTKCAKYHTHINDIFLSALGKSYHSLTGESSVSVQMEGHGRESFAPDLCINRTIGWFTSIYPVVLSHLEQNLSYIVRETKKMMQQIPKNGFGYGVLYGIETQCMPLFTFNYLGRMSEDTNNGMFTLSKDYSTGVAFAPENHCGTDINFNGLLIDDKISFFVDYNSIRYTRTQMKTLISAFTSALEDIVTYLQSNVSSNLMPDNIQKSDTEENEDIHVYSSHPDKKPLIFVHTANTGSEAYYRLAKYIKDDFSFSVLEQYNINHPENPMDDIHSLAAKYIEIIKKIQPHGPYNIGGWCFGGTVAYEIAQQLKLAGETVEKLILLDSHIIESKDLCDKLLMSSAKHSLEYLSTSPLLEEARKKRVLEKYIANSALVSHMWMEYNPPKHDGTMLYFKACVKPEGITGAFNEMYNCIMKQKAAGYEKRVNSKNLTIIEVPKDHDSLMDDDALQIIVPAIADYMSK